MKKVSLLFFPLEFFLTTIFTKKILKKLQNHRLLQLGPIDKVQLYLLQIVQVHPFLAEHFGGWPELVILATLGQAWHQAGRNLGDRDMSRNLWIQEIVPELQVADIWPCLQQGEVRSCRSPTQDRRRAGQRRNASQSVHSRILRCQDYVNIYIAHLSSLVKISFLRVRGSTRHTGQGRRQEFL